MIYIGKTLARIAEEKPEFHDLACVYLLDNPDDRAKHTDTAESLQKILERHPELRMCVVKDYHRFQGTHRFFVSAKIKGKYRCPKCGCQKFIATAHVTQSWQLNKNGDFVDRISECDEVTHKPSEADLWDCYDCGFSAIGARFSLDWSERVEQNH